MTETDGGVRIRLRVKPGARKTAIVGQHAGALKISVQAPPERGKANRAVVELLARVFGVPAASVSILAGETSQDKVAFVPVAAARANELLAAALSSPRSSARASGSSS